MGARGVAAAVTMALVVVAGVAGCRGDQEGRGDSRDADQHVVVEDPTGDTWRQSRNQQRERRSTVTRNVDLAGFSATYTPQALTLEVTYAEPLDPKAGDFGFLVAIARDNQADSSQTLEWWSSDPRTTRTGDASTGPTPCHPKAAPDFAAGRVTVTWRLGGSCLSKNGAPDRYLLHRVTTWADGGLEDSLFTDGPSEVGDVWIPLTDRP